MSVQAAQPQVQVDGVRVGQMAKHRNRRRPTGDPEKRPGQEKTMCLLPRSWRAQARARTASSHHTASGTSGLEIQATSTSMQP